MSSLILTLTYSTMTKKSAGKLCKNKQNLDQSLVHCLKYDRKSNLKAECKFWNSKRTEQLQFVEVHNIFGLFQNQPKLSSFTKFYVKRKCWIKKKKTCIYKGKRQQINFTYSWKTNRNKIIFRIQPIAFNKEASSKLTFFNQI